MLLEAAHVDLAIARLQAAVRIAPARRAVQWEIGRAFALQHDWDGYDRLEAELMSSGLDRAFLRARFALWRGDVAKASEILGPVTRQVPAFEPGLEEVVDATYFRGRWADVRERALAMAKRPAANRRRSTFLAQLLAEMAGFAGDGEAAAEIVTHAIGEGLFDLHWLDRCPLLDSLRALPRCASLRAVLQARSNAILDALYGEEDLGTLDTAVAPSAVADHTLRLT
jgi:serine/threonine-protein kinase